MSNADDGDELLDIDGLAAKLKLPKASVYKLVAADRIPGQKVGKHWRFLRSEIDAWLRAGMRAGRTSSVAETAGPAGTSDQRSAPAHFQASGPAEKSDQPLASPLLRVFSGPQVDALQDRWIETPKQFLAQVELAGGRHRLAELLQISEDQLQQKIIEVAMLVATSVERPASDPGAALD